MVDNQVVGLQLLSFLIKKFDYQIVRIKNIKTKDFWLINPTQNYPLICITQDLYSQENIKQSIFGQIYSAITTSLRQHSKCLVINTNVLSQKFEVDSIIQIPLLEDQPIDEVLKREFIGIEDSVKKVKNAEKEKKSLLKSLNKMTGNSNPLTSGISILCIVMFIAIQLLTLISKDEITSSIILGSYYKINIVGAYEYWRLLTSGFLHIDIFHLLMNLMSFMFLGNLIENKLSKLQYIVVLFTSIIVGNLFVLIGDANIVGVGISGGLYGFLGVYTVLLYTSGAYKNRQALYSFVQVMSLNIFISLMPNISGLAHFGGYLAGLVLGIWYSNHKYLVHFKKHVLISFMAVLIGCLTWLPDVTRIDPIYGGTDAMIIYTLRELNLDGYADYLLNRYDAHLADQGENGYKLAINKLVEELKEEYNEKN